MTGGAVGIHPDRKKRRRKVCLLADVSQLIACTHNLTRLISAGSASLRCIPTPHTFIHTLTCPHTTPHARAHTKKTSCSYLRKTPKHQNRSCLHRSYVWLPSGWESKAIAAFWLRGRGWETAREGGCEGTEGGGDEGGQRGQHSAAMQQWCRQTFLLCSGTSLSLIVTKERDVF